MSHLPQDLHDVFPDDEALLRRLKAQDQHFRNLADRYATLDQEISQIGLALAPASDERTEDLKKQRLLVLDEIAAVVQAARRAA
ncbi:YdcH family protein [Thermaurantiacus sp.]